MTITRLPVRHTICRDCGTPVRVGTDCELCAMTARMLEHMQAAIELQRRIDAMREGQLGKGNN